MKKKKDANIIVYEPNKFLKIGFFKIWIIMFSDLIKSYSLGWRLFVRDFSAKYRQQVFGVLWALIVPVIAVTTFTLMAKAKVLNVSGINAPYPIYSFLGVTFWALIQGIIIQISGVINKTGGMIGKINFPKDALLISPFYITMIDFIIKMLLFIFVCLYYKYLINPKNIAYIFCLIPAVLFSFGLGMFLAVVGAVAKDIVNFLSYFFQFLMIFTPILYPIPTGTFLGNIAKYNPFYYLVAVPRDLILFGKSSYINGFIITSAISLIIFIAGWRFYKISISRIIEKV